MSRLHVAGREIAFKKLGRRGPVIVFEAGLGQDMSCWDGVVRPLATHARLVLYDRPGIGRSGPRTDVSVLMADTVADQLRSLLQAMDTQPPYVLVGHSLGGFYMHAFARMYPQDTAGVVLVDSASPFEPLGVFGPTAPPAPDSIAAAEEAGFAPSAAAMLAGPRFPPVPLIVLAATDHGVTPELEALWQEVQAQTAALSPKGRLVVIEGSGHFIQGDHPQVVIDAVLDAMREAKSGDHK
jgi:pimeloyl-ACP methyl ester carboxylesterase